MATAVCGSANRAAPDRFRGCAEIRSVVGQSPLPPKPIDADTRSRDPIMLIAASLVILSQAQTCIETGPRLFPRAFPRESAKAFRTFPFPAVEPAEMLRLGP